MNTRLVLAAFAGSLLLTSMAAADVAPPPGYVETCTLEKKQTTDNECLSCSVGHPGTPMDRCETLLEAYCYKLECDTRGASVHQEIWCRDKSLKGAAVPKELVDQLPKTGESPVLPPGVTVKNCGNEVIAAGGSTSLSSTSAGGGTAILSTGVGGASATSSAESIARPGTGGTPAVKPATVAPRSDSPTAQAAAVPSNTIGAAAPNDASSNTNSAAPSSTDTESGCSVAIAPRATKHAWLPMVCAIGAALMRLRRRGSTSRNK